MTTRRRPLIYEEVSDRQRRQVSTGRGQARARPVRLFPTKVKKPQELQGALAVPDSWVAFRELSQSVAGPSTVVLSPTLYDFRGDYSWLQDDTAFNEGWTILQSGLYVIHVECSASTARAAGNCVQISPTAGSDYPAGRWLSIPFLADSSLATTSPITAAGCVTKAISQDEIDTGPVSINFRYLGASASLSTVLTFEKVL